MQIPLITNISGAKLKMMNSKNLKDNRPYLSKMINDLYLIMMIKLLTTEDSKEK